MATDKETTQGLTDAVRLLLAHQIKLDATINELRREVRDSADTNIALKAQIATSQQSGWVDWSKNHPTQATLIILALLFSLSGQLSQLSSIFGVLNAATH